MILFTSQKYNAPLNNLIWFHLTNTAKLFLPQLKKEATKWWKIVMYYWSCFLTLQICLDSASSDADSSGAPITEAKHSLFTDQRTLAISVSGSGILVKQYVWSTFQIQSSKTCIIWFLLRNCNKKDQKGKKAGNGPFKNIAANKILLKALVRHFAPNV